MGTTADKLEYLHGTKAAIKEAIVSKGVAVPDGTTFRAYAEKISSIQDVSSLPTQGTKTVTPTTTEQIAVASGTYTTGDIKVAGDANLVAENIAEGVSIFGVAGTHSGGGGGPNETAQGNLSGTKVNSLFAIFVDATNNQASSVSVGGIGIPNPPTKLTISVYVGDIIYISGANVSGGAQKIKDYYDCYVVTGNFSATAY